MNKERFPSDASIITTYRCQMRCKMCNIWKYPTDEQKEMKPSELEILPKLNFVNLTGGEPFLREDLEEIVTVMFRKSPRIVISTSGWHYEKIIAFAKKFPKVGFRISLEGLQYTNDFLRGREGGFNKGFSLVKELKQMGIKDVGFGITISDSNHQDLMELYEISKNMHLEFATAVIHNSFYFHKENNQIIIKTAVIDNLTKLINAMLKENHPKSWFRAYFNFGLIKYINGERRILPCEAGSINFFLDPYGDIYPCNGLQESIWKVSMGNIREVKNFEEIWNSERAQKIRDLVHTCPKNCWMVGTVSPVMKKYIHIPAKWVIKNKINNILGYRVCFNSIS